MNDPATAQTLRMGTRGSLLAKTQSGWVADQLRAARGVDTATTIISTLGDRILDAPLSQVGGKGLFVREIEEALLASSIDYAVHSLKDLPADQPEGLVLAALPPREDPRDVLIPRSDLVAACTAVANPLDALPQGARVGTSSLRRMAFLKAARPDLEVVPLRGNVDTRLRKGRDGEGGLLAVVLAAAGLKRLGWLDDATMFPLPVEAMLPAVGQGILAIESRAADLSTLGHLQALDHAPTRAAALVERGFLGAVGGGCQVPLACHAVGIDGGARLRVLACIAEPDGSAILRDGAEIEANASAAQLVALGEALAQRLLQRGGDAILERCVAAGVTKA